MGPGQLDYTTISGFISLFPSVRSPLRPPTQLLHYGYPHSTARSVFCSTLSLVGLNTPAGRGSGAGYSQVGPLHSSILPLLGLNAAHLSSS